MKPTSRDSRYCGLRKARSRQWHSTWLQSFMVIKVKVKDESCFWTNWIFLTIKTIKISLTNSVRRSALLWPGIRVMIYISSKDNRSEINVLCYVLLHTHIDLLNWINGYWINGYWINLFIKHVTWCKKKHFKA